MSGTVGDNVARASGVIASAGGGGGKILQMVQEVITDTASGSFGSFAAVSGYEIAITPTKESSKIQLTYSCGLIDCNANSGFKIARDIAGGGYSYLPTGDGSGVRTQCMFATGEISRFGGFSSYLDSPSYTLTDEITYQMHAYCSGGTLSLNRDRTDNNYTYRFRPISTLQLWEISA